jgi:hypothetical protein
VGQKDPRLGEDFFHFELVQLGIRQNPHLHFTGVQVDEVRDLGSIGQHRIATRQHISLLGASTIAGMETNLRQFLILCSTNAGLPGIETPAVLIYLNLFRVFSVVQAVNPIPLR